MIMPKNIILCADGTGNEGGHTPDSNVFKIFNAIDLNSDSPKQITFYDNGVGTQRNKYIKGLSGALGFGFGRNVRDLYEFLARHYDPGDNIYLFGFSRGAATIRAFNGFVHTCGLIDGRGSGFHELQEDIKCAMKAYRKPKRKDIILSKLKLKRHKGKITINAIGVWDTVAALGLPHKIVWPISLIFKSLNFIFDKTLFPYRFYNYELTPNVERAYQAIAINDERKSFWPKVWKENTEAAQQVNTIDQVWFAGMHSNVGGGYERAGLAYICLHWMMTKVSELKFKDDVKEEVFADADASGRMYNSRNGHAVFFRYDPRNVTEMCKEAGLEAKVHESVIDRLKTRIANYAPTLLPQRFKIVNDLGNSTDSPKVHEEDWNIFHKQMLRWIGIRKLLYGALITLTLGIASAIFIFKKDENFYDKADDPLHIETLDFLTPDLSDGFIRTAFADHPYYGIGLVFLCIAYYLARGGAKKKTIKIAEKLRKLILIAPNPYPSKKGGEAASDSKE